MLWLCSQYIALDHFPRANISYLLSSKASEICLGDDPRLTDLWLLYCRRCVDGIAAAQHAGLQDPLRTLAQKNLPYRGAQEAENLRREGNRLFHQYKARSMTDLIKLDGVAQLQRTLDRAFELACYQL